MRHILTLILCLCAVTAQSQTRTNAVDGDFSFQRDKALRGSPLLKKEMSPGQRRVCAETCAANTLCEGYNWRKRKEGRPPECSLLFEVFSQLDTPHFHSGKRVRSLPDFEGTRELDTRIDGVAYRSVILPKPGAKLCRKACGGDSACAAYTYFRPGVIRANSPPTCVLNSEILRRTRGADCCISGAKSDSFVFFRFRPDTKMEFLTTTTQSVADVKACVHLCKADDNCRYATYRKTTANNPQGACELSSNPPTSVTTDTGYTTYERSTANIYMYGSRPGVAAGGSTYSKIYLDIPRAQGLALCRAACANDAQCKAANYVAPGVRGLSAECNLKNTTSSAAFNDCCTANSRIPNTKPPSLITPDTVPTRLQFSANSSTRIIEGDRYPLDMPNVRFPVNWQGCSQNDKDEIKRAWARAHHNVWRATQVMSHLNAQKRRADMWEWSFDPLMGTDPNYTNISPRAFFGRYNHGRFHDVRRSIDKLFHERFRGKTFKAKCRLRDNDGAHPCETFNANANHSIYGTINFCARWFDRSSFLDQTTILTHEMLHWMKIPKSAYWIADRHDYWESCRKYKAVRALYDDDAVWLGMNRGCKDWNYNRAVRVNDTYAWWINTLGDRIWQGTLPQFPAEDF